VKAHVVVHVRAVAGGPVVVTPVPFVDLAFEAPSFEAAVDGLLPMLRGRLESLEPVDRLPFATAANASLSRVPVEVTVGGKGGETIELVVGVVVIAREAGGKPVLVGYAPVLPNVEVIVREGGIARLGERMAQRIANRMRSWRSAEVLNADEPEDTRLEVVEFDVAGGASDGSDRGATTADGDGVLSRFGVDLTRQATGGMDGRDELLRRVLETLAADGRSSVLLVGAPDVGKTALVHELARRVAAGEVPERLRGRRVWRISGNELIAGAQYTGQWQERVHDLIAASRRKRPILAMGDPIGIVDAGRWSKSDNNVSRYLRPFMESGELTVICECTTEQLAAVQRKEPSFVGAFHRIDIPEPSREQVGPIAAAAAARLARTAEVEIDPSAVAAAVELTGRFEPYRSFPGKSIRLLEDAVREREDDVMAIGRAEVTAAFARRSGMPLAFLSDDVPLRMAEVRRHFEERVLGQPEATATVVDLVAVLKAGLNDPQKPLQSLFFVGPTGVGKTELAKTLAEFLFGSRERMVRFDMGEYPSPDAVQRLIGTAWGSTEGELTRRVREQPFCVVLLDEVEKAHWSVFDALLAALGEGRLSDAAGRVADFRNAIVIMTSNLGATRARSGLLGFAGTGAADAATKYVEEAEKFFRPEFFNRIDRIVVFHPLTQEIVRQIARRELARLFEREGIMRRELLIEVDDAAVDAVASTGFHPRYGARPLQREIERRVIHPLARLVVDRRPGAGEFIRLYVADGELAVSVERVREVDAPTARRERKATQDDSGLTRAERAAADFVDELASHEAATIANELRGTVSGLVGVTHDSSFWDDPDAARTTLQRIYRLERLLDRHDALVVRADGLTQLARRIRENRDRARVGEVAAAIEEMRDQLLVLRLELAAAAAGPETGAATIRVTPVGPPAAGWARQLLAMYAAWAERTGRDAVSDVDEALSVTIDGPATLALLAGEAGLHRHVLPDGTEQLARVTVVDPAETADAPEAGGTVARVYEEGKRRVVRDPRTGARLSHVASVLEKGHIDVFLIAALRDRAAVAATRSA
jgi:ATP-dependent Clp protease ATP-binding subunit ClpA